MSFPSPIGGIALSSDLAPSIVFSVLFGLLYPFMIYKALHKRSRNILYINIFLTLAERPIVFAFRAHQSQTPSWQTSYGWLKYMQLSFTLGYVSLSQDLPKILRAFIVSTSQPPPFEDGSTPGEDHPRIRHFTRRGMQFFDLAYISAIVPGVLSSLWLNGSIGNPDPTRGNKVIAMRYASASVTLFLNIVLAVWIIVVASKIPRMDRKAVKVFLTLCFVLSIPAVYRLGVMHSRTEGNALSLSPDTPGSLNGPKDKALFYIFQIIPEVIAGVIYFVLFNIRELFRTGFMGDPLWRDLTAEEKEKIARKKKEKEEAKARKAANNTEVV